ncbi:MAG TPA: hypothetical protein VJ810_22080 [Blastocatellia bacterium]|nr:hypothetical protein [Blastocatellia bacterium]
MGIAKQEITINAKNIRKNLIKQSKAIADAKVYAQKQAAQADQRMSDARAAQQQLDRKKADYHNQLGDHFDKALLNHNTAKAHSASVERVPIHVIVSIPEGTYQQAWQNMVDSGYRPIYFNGYEISKKSYFRGLNTQTFFNVIFIKDQRGGWASFHGLDSQQYQDTFNRYSRSGFRLAQINCYLSGGQIRYAPIFIKESWPAWVAYHGLTRTEHQSRFNDLVKQGYRLANLSMVYYGGTIYYAALYDKQNVGGWMALAQIDSARYQTEFDNNAKLGRILSYLDVCSINGVPYFSAIWDSSRRLSYYARHNIDAATYHSEYLKMTSQVWAPRIVTGYQNGDNVNYAAMWSQ